MVYSKQAESTRRIKPDVCASAAQTISPARGFAAKPIKSPEELVEQTLKITPHSGGMEAKDFCAMLWKMVEKYLANEKIAYRLLEDTPYHIIVTLWAPEGFLDFFTGIIKLVRVSPFAKADKVHTSYCHITLERSHKKVVAQIKESDLSWDFFKAPGPGGQHKNKTLTAVRLTHVPTMTIVTSSSQRSQHDNKKKALEQLRLELDKQGNMQLLQSKQLSWQNAMMPKDASISFYFNHQMVCNDKKGIKTSRLKDVLNGQLNLLK